MFMDVSLTCIYVYVPNMYLVPQGCLKEGAGSLGTRVADGCD